MTPAIASPSTNSPTRPSPFPTRPLTFLLHAAIIRLFGRVYFPHILCAAIEAGAATLLTWRILLALLKPLSGYAWSLATLLATPLIVLGIYGIYPHPIYDSDAILAVLVALYLFQRSTSGTAVRPVIGFFTGAAFVLPLFFKQNIGLPFLFVTLAAAAAIAIARSRQRISVSPQLWLFTGALVTLAAALLTIHAAVGLHNYLYWTITFARQRRLPGFAVMLSTYRQASLLWTIPAAIIALVILHRTELRVGHPERALSLANGKLKDVRFAPRIVILSAAQRSRRTCGSQGRSPSSSSPRRSSGPSPASR